MKISCFTYIKFLTVFCCVLLVGIIRLQAQSGKSKLDVKFITYEKLITNGELISNVVRIYNAGDDSVVFRINADFPPSWRQISKFKDQYTVGPQDSMFLPVRLIPSGNLLGNNRFMISVFLIGKDDSQLGNDLFWAFTQKHTSWSISSDQGSKIYFKNGSNEAKFNINLLNTGTERQPIILSLNNMSLFSEITDSSGVNRYKQPVNVSLDTYQDTSFDFVFKYTQGVRNHSRIDIENYRPENLNEEKTFNLLVTSEEPNFGQPGAFQAGQRIVFKKLSDDKRANAQSYSQLPVIVDYNVSNLMDNMSFSTINIRGSAQLSFNEQLVYNFQASAVSNQYSDFMDNNNYYVGYFSKKGNVQLGYINGGLMGIQSFGKGIKSSYMLDKKKTVTGFYIVKKDKNDRETLVSYGSALDINYFKQNKARVEIGRSENKVTGVDISALSMRMGYNFFKSHSFNFSLSNTLNDIHNLSQGTKQTYGYFLMGNYTGNFVRNKLNWNHGFGHNSSDYANSNVERTYYNHRMRYIFNDNWSATLVNNYNNITSGFYNNIENTSYTNQFSVNRSFRSKSFQPLVFYNVFLQRLYSYNIKGLGFNFNQFNVKTNTRFSTSIQLGVNAPMNIPNAEATTFMQWNTLVFYKTLTLNARYLVGTYGYVPQAAGATKADNQQLFTTSAQHQYVLKNTKVMLQTGVNYFYNNLFSQHSITLAPEIYYFTSDGWRFRVGVNYNLISSISLRNSYSAAQSLPADEQSRLTVQNTFIAVGIRKEFSVPIPFKKVRFADVDISAFFDVNGNGVKDKNERVVENVIVKIGEEEVITNAEGEAHIRNATMKRHTLTAMSLDDMDGWFPNIEDSILVAKNKALNIPFVKGVKIKGKISIDRESINADSDDPFDLSRIRITANGHKQFSVLTDFNGAFEFYLPYGHYILTMDESVLGSKYKVARNNYEIEVNKEADGMVMSYLIIERKRKIVRKVFTQPQPETSPAKPVQPAPKGK